jgi:hypothetical protein
MSFRPFQLAAAVFIAIALLALPIATSIAVTSALAQDVMVPMPDEYVAPDTAPGPEQIPDPTAMLQDDGSTFAIPIPGGGEIQVEGPASETPAFIGPTENWSTQRTNPFSVGTGPLGPITPAQ